jgi:hypothetical protein
MSSIVRLSTGEELLCDYEVIDSDHMGLKAPYLILPTAEGSIQFMKYMAYAVYTILPVKTSNIMWIVEANTELSSKYREMTGKIAINAGQKIIT